MRNAAGRNGNPRLAGRCPAPRLSSSTTCDVSCWQPGLRRPSSSSSTGSRKAIVNFANGRSRAITKKSMRNFMRRIVADEADVPKTSISPFSFPLRVLHHTGEANTSSRAITKKPIRNFMRRTEADEADFPETRGKYKSQQKGPGVGATLLSSDPSVQQLAGARKSVPVEAAQKSDPFLVDGEDVAVIQDMVSKALLKMKCEAMKNPEYRKIVIGEPGSSSSCFEPGPWDDPMEGKAMLVEHTIEDIDFDCMQYNPYEKEEDDE